MDTHAQKTVSPHALNEL